MPTAAIYMFIALGFYTYAVLSGRKEGLKWRHLIAFGIGLAMDAKGTYGMTLLAKAMGGANPFHYITGLAGLWGMAFHFVLALLATFMRKADKVNQTFHKVSLVIYILWLAAFSTGVVIGMIGH